jgi:hypothetical protein
MGCRDQSRPLATKIRRRRERREQQVKIRGPSTTIVGIMPAGFNYPMLRTVAAFTAESGN